MLTKLDYHRGAIGKQSAEFILETFDHDHIAKIKSDIEAAGFVVSEI